MNAFSTIYTSTSRSTDPHLHHHPYQQHWRSRQHQHPQPHPQPYSQTGRSVNCPPLQVFPLLSSRFCLLQPSFVYHGHGHHAPAYYHDPHAAAEGIHRRQHLFSPEDYYHAATQDEEEGMWYPRVEGLRSEADFEVVECEEEDGGGNEEEEEENGEPRRGTRAGYAETVFDIEEVVDEHEEGREDSMGEQAGDGDGDGDGHSERCDERLQNSYAADVDVDVESSLYLYS